MTPYLSDAELLHICYPLTQPAAMTRHLRAMGYHITRRPNGWPLITRANFEAVGMGHAQIPANGAATPGPDVRALLDRFQKKEPSYGDGEKTQIQPARAAQ